MDKKSSHPFYVKLSLNLISLSILAAVLVIGKNIVVPIFFAILLANLLLPITRFLVARKFNQTLSILLPVMFSVITGVGVIYFMSIQVLHFMDDVPALKERVSDVSDSLQRWIKESTNIPVRRQNQYVSETVDDLKERAPQLVGKTFVSVTAVLIYVVLLPLYTFLILYYRTTIRAFLIGVFKNGSAKKVNEVLTESTTIAQQYIAGLLIETTLVFILNTIGFLILGIQYAVFLALLAALLNLIPYVGMLTANVVCILITFISADSPGDAIWVGVILAGVQFFDNNFGMPIIVGNKVRINALVTIVGVLLGGTLCGIPGMFLAIPALAFLKVVFDNVPELNAWGILLSDHGAQRKKPKRSSAQE